jgi:predicted Zn-dependent peptidase
MSDPNAQYSQQLFRELYPTTTYHHNSGGEPTHIPSLTHQQLLDFHKVHYHPSNSFFLTYGDLPLESTLSVIEDRVLNQFSAIDPNTDVPDEQRFSAPKRVHGHCPLMPGLPEDRQERASVSFLLNNVKVGFGDFPNPTVPVLASLIFSRLLSSYFFLSLSLISLSLSLSLPMYISISCIAISRYLFPQSIY